MRLTFVSTTGSLVTILDLDLLDFSVHIYFFEEA